MSIKQYKFTDTVNPPKYYEVGIETEIDGINLDRMVRGFDTLTVAGRELLGRELVTQNYKTTRVGRKTRANTNQQWRGNSAIKNRVKPNQLLSSNTNSRTLVIQYRLECEDEIEFRRQFELLNYYLHKEEVQIHFSDDPEFYYIGTLSEVDEVEPTSNSVIATFSIECLDSFKYTRREQIWKFNTRDIFRQTSYYPIEIEQIKLTINAATSSLRLQVEETGQFLLVHHAFALGEVVIFDFLEGDVRTDKGESLNVDFDIFSDFEEFTIDQGQTLRSLTSTTIEMTYRQKVL